MREANVQTRVSHQLMQDCFEKSLSARIPADLNYITYTSRLVFSWKATTLPGEVKEADMTTSL